MEILLKASAIAVTGGALALVLKKNSPDMALLLTVAVACCTVYLAASLMRDTVGFMTDLTQLTGIPSPAVSAVMKAAGIGVVTRLTADVCKDAGQTAPASAVELTGAAAALFAALPLMKSVLEMIRSLL